MNVDSQVISGVAEVAAKMASQRNTASAAASACIECMVASASPLIWNMFTDTEPQNRLLFTLVLAGSCTTLTEQEDGENYSIEVSINPKTINEAFRVYQLITGKDIKPHLPPEMVSFANSGQSRFN